MALGIFFNTRLPGCCGAGWVMWNMIARRSGGCMSDVVSFSLSLLLYVARVGISALSGEVTLWGVVVWSLLAC